MVSPSSKQTALFRQGRGWCRRKDGSFLGRNPRELCGEVVSTGAQAWGCEADAAACISGFPERPLHPSRRQRASLSAHAGAASGLISPVARPPSFNLGLLHPSVLLLVAQNCGDLRPSGDLWAPLSQQKLCALCVLSQALFFPGRNALARAGVVAQW